MASVAVPVRGIDLYFEECGTGPAVIVAHGALGSVATTSFRPAALADRGFRVVSYDARGHGRSGFSEQPNDYRRNARADDLLGLMDSLGITQASIVGTSMGACTALTVASRAPGRIARMILRAPSPFPPDVGPARISLTCLALAYRYLGVTLTSHLGAVGSPAAGRPRFRAMLASQRQAAVVPAIQGVLSELLYPPGLADITVPALIVGHPGSAFTPSRLRRHSGINCRTHNWS